VAAVGPPAISQRTLGRRVRQIACWRRPRLVAKGDPDREQVLAALRQAIATLPQGAVVLAEDETHLDLLPWVRATWIPTGQRQRVMTPGTNRRRTIFGAVDVASGRWFYQVAHKAVSATFTAFLEQLLAAYPAAPVVAVEQQRVANRRPFLDGEMGVGGPFEREGLADHRVQPARCRLGQRRSHQLDHRGRRVSTGHVEDRQAGPNAAGHGLGAFVRASHP
jgi:DDE superfamily endonuclease